ncbi:MAG: hypothetical protein HZY73_14010 [Micropruina sp.]|nr:MAG: hypothetical protein HZY73_14010 [Micropruina sp.]
MASDEEVAALKARIAELEAEVEQLRAAGQQAPADASHDEERGEFNPG